MRIALCNEVIAPYSLSNEPHEQRFAPLFAALRRHRYAGGIMEAVEG